MKIRRTQSLLGITIFLVLAAVIYFHITPSVKQTDLTVTEEQPTPLPLWKKEVLKEPAHVRTIDLNNVSALVEAGRQIQQQYGAVLFCMINDAYFDFAASWCCNTGPLDVHKQVLFLTTDLKTGQRLKTLWPNVSVVAFKVPQFTGFHNYSKVGHVRMMTERTRVILRLLEAGVRVLLFEVDCLWLKNPVSLVLTHQSGGDIVGTRVAGKDVTAAGFLLLNPTATTVKFWRQLTQDLDQLVNTLRTRQKTAGVAESKNEQEYFTTLARKKFAGINIVYLSGDVFRDGKWYSLPEKQRRESQPVIINNNWVIGKVGKKQRAKAFGHWFWDEQRGTCNDSAIHHLFH